MILHLWIISQKNEYLHCVISAIIDLNLPPTKQNQKVRGKIELYQRQRLHRNVNRLFDTRRMNRISGKPLKTRDSGTLAVAGIPCLLFGWFENLRRSLEGGTFEPSSKGI